MNMLYIYPLTQRGELMICKLTADTNKAALRAVGEKMQQSAFFTNNGERQDRHVTCLTASLTP